MRILILSNEYPPHIYGGTGVHVDHLCHLCRELMRIPLPYNSPIGHIRYRHSVLLRRTDSNQNFSGKRKLLRWARG